MKFSDDNLLRLIAVFKFFKAASLIALGIGAFRLRHRDVAGLAQHWVHVLGLEPGNHYVNAALGKISHVSPDQIKQLGLGSFLYAGLFLVEGSGLWLRKRWGEWLTVVITGSLVPLEVYEIHRHFTWAKVGLLVINVATVAYLIYHVRSRKT